MSDELEGGCACGEVRYRLKKAPMFVHCCHCRECQRHSGSAFVLNAILEREHLEILSGDPVPYQVPTHSGGPHGIYHCEACQTAVWSDYGSRNVLRFVRVGTLDDPTQLPPDVHIFTRSKMSWVTLPEDALSFPVYYDRNDHWPAESLARWQQINS
ncbi:MAG: GFA family protein [Proteobacteria bacterium]|nr:GFA family protein [Pseudomonadota bacterium]